MLCALFLKYIADDTITHQYKVYETHLKLVFVQNSHPSSIIYISFILHASNVSSQEKNKNKKQACCFSRRLPYSHCLQISSLESFSMSYWEKDSLLAYNNQRAVHLKKRFSFPGCMWNSLSSDDDSGYGKINTVKLQWEPFHSKHRWIKVDGISKLRYFC